MKRSSVFILSLTAVAFLGGLVGSLSARSERTEPAPEVKRPRHLLGKCLRLDPERQARIEALDPKFSDDLDALREDLGNHRRELAALLDATESTDDEIRACVEQSIETHNRLERRVLEHLLLVRSELTPDEQKRLFHFISDRIRRHHADGFGGPPGGEGWRGRRGGPNAVDGGATGREDRGWRGKKRGRWGSGAPFDESDEPGQNDDQSEND